MYGPIKEPTRKLFGFRFFLVQPAVRSGSDNTASARVGRERTDALNEAIRGIEGSRYSELRIWTDRTARVVLSGLKARAGN